MVHPRNVKSILGLVVLLAVGVPLAGQLMKGRQAGDPFEPFELPDAAGEARSVATTGERPLVLGFANGGTVDAALTLLEQAGPELDRILILVGTGPGALKGRTPELPVLVDERGEVFWSYAYASTGDDGPFPAFVLARGDRVLATWSGRGRDLAHFLER